MTTRQAFRDLFAYRELVRALTLKELHLRVRGTALGMAWHLLTPLAQIGVYYFAFAVVLRVSSVDRLGLFITLGIVHWTFMSQTLTMGTGTVHRHASLIDKVAFPRLTLPVSLAAAGLIQHLLMLAALVPFFLTLGGEVTGWMALYLPILALTVLFTAGAAMLLSALAVFFKDLEQITGIALSVAFFLSPVVYTFTSLPARIQYVLLLNPFAAYLDGMRAALFYGQNPPLGTWVLMVGWAVVAVAAGWTVFRRLEARFTEAL